MRARLLSILCCLVGCDDGGTVAPPAADRGAPDATAMDAALDDMAAGPDTSVELDATLDAGVDQMVDGAPGPRCAIRPSPRGAAAWRVEGCDWIAEGEGVRVPRALVVSGDALVRNARTPLHTALSYQQLAALDVEWVWLLATWDGVAPRVDTFNGAYLGRICEQIGFAHDAGLQVVLSMHQERWGVALGGHGAPAWATPPNLEPVPPGATDAPALDQAWAAFWADEALRGAFLTAWRRLLDTCADTDGLIGIQALADPRGAPDAVAALTAEVRAEAEARFGPLLLFVDGAHPVGDAPDVVWAPTAWAGRGPSMAVPSLEPAAAHARRAGVPLFVRGVPLSEDGFTAAEAQGAGYAGWHDGFGLDALALRDEDGVIGDRGPAIRDRVWPVVLSGSLIGFGPTPAGVSVRWRPDGRNAGLSVVRVGRAPVEAEIIGGGPDDFAAHDALTGELSVFVQSDGAEVIEVRIRR